MYSIYIRHFVAPSDWADAGEIHEDECLMYTLPAEYPDNEILIDPKVKNEMGKAGSFEFGMETGNPFYSSLLQLTTMMRVKYDDETIFFGRVLSIDTDMWGKRKVHCEGALAFLLDTLIIGTKEEEREKITLQKYVQDLINSHNGLVTDDPNKRFELGHVPGHYPNRIPSYMRPKGETRKFGTGSWTSTMNCLEDLTSQYGGYWRVYYEENDYVDTIGQYGLGNIDLNNRKIVMNDDGSFSTELSITITDTVGGQTVYVLIPTIIDGAIVSDEDAAQYYHTSGEYLGKFSTNAAASEYAEELHVRQQWYYTGHKNYILYLDWLLNMFDPDVSNQPIHLTENVIDMSNTVDVNGIFTVLIPEGVKNGKPLYLDDVPKTIVKGTREKKDDKEPVGPGYDEDPDDQE